jgi:hypothetical protein
MQALRSPALAALLLVAAHAHGQTTPADANGPWIFDTHTPGACSPTGAPHGGCDPGELIRIHVTTVVTGLVRPWHLTFLPGSNDLLSTGAPEFCAGGLPVTSVRNVRFSPQRGRFR